MCGIAGFTTQSSTTADSQDRIVQMLRLIHHRGPDGAGYFCDDLATLGSVRLSVIDVQGGDQPLCDESGRYWIAYNGEVYNYQELSLELTALGHRFQTHSDTEVVLKAWMQWKAEAFEKLNGGFAVALYDSKTGELVLARDRFGKRPLFFARHGQEILFASEMKAFLAFDEFKFSFDRSVLSKIATWWTPFPTETAFKNIFSVAPGEFITVGKKGLSHHSYFTDELGSHKTQMTLKDATEKTRSLLSESVELRLRSEVEVGTYLSGGLDSSIVTLLASKKSPKTLKTFSVTFADTDFDESKFQEEVANALGTKHMNVHVNTEDIVSSFEEALWYGETPVFRTAFVPLFLLSQRVREEGIKVVLTGEGADEVFLGYDIFKEVKLRRQFKNLTLDQKRGEVLKLYPYLNHFTEANATALVGLYERFSDEKYPGLYSHEIRLHNSKGTTRLLKDFTDSIEIVQASLARRQNRSDIEKAQWLEWNTLLTGYLLSTQGDRMSFAHGVESRCPFLDPNVVRWGSSLPEEMRLFGWNEKYILKKAFPELPTTILNRPKQPYRAPDATAFLKERKKMDQWLCDLNSIESINTQYATAFVDRISKNSNVVSQADNQALIFLLSLTLLHKQFVQREIPVSLPALSSRCRVIDKRTELRRAA